jgi:hypothetical protein
MHQPYRAKKEKHLLPLIEAARAQLPPTSTLC